jgi:hypothetical protein
MAVITPTAKAQFIDAAGVPLAGGFVYTYAAGTTTPQTTYTDSTGATANSNPIVLDARGEASIWLGSATYKFKLTDSNGTEIWTVDNISAPTSGLSPVLSGNVTIDSNTSGTALTITQTGTGLALKIEDQSSDPTPFVVDSTGRVGIGTISPSTSLDVNDGTIQLSSSGTSRTTLSADASNSTLTSVGTRGLILAANSANLIYGTSSGYVGIKNASPTVELDVTGAFKTSGAITGGTSITSGTTLASGTTLTAGSSLNVTTSATIGTTLSVDTVQEKTASAGVSVNNTLKVDTISGKTTATTLTIAGVSIASSQVAPANRVITAATAQATTSGTSKDFTSIPSWVKRITVLFQGVSTNGSAYIRVQIGTGGSPTTSGYTSISALVYGSPGSIATTGGFDWYSNSASYTLNGAMTIHNITGNSWVASGVGGVSSLQAGITLGGSVSLGGVLNIVRVTTDNGTDAFDTGTVNIFYE